MPDRFRILISGRAASDLALIHQYIEKDSPQNAASVVAELVQALDSLQALPHRYPVYQGRRLASQQVRRMPVPPYLIYYRVDDRTLAVGIITIRHGKRRQPGRFA